MFAVIKTGGKQYRVSPGETVRVEKIQGEPGAEVELGPVLLLSADDRVQVGLPFLDTVSVKGLIVAQDRAKKILVFKSKRRKGYRRKRGHRQSFTELRITEIKEN